jgi:hypothetical protein
MLTLRISMPDEKVSPLGLFLHLLRRRILGHCHRWHSPALSSLNEEYPEQFALDDKQPSGGVSLRGHPHALALDS